MTAISHSNGNKIYYKDGHWHYEDGQLCNHERGCVMCGDNPGSKKTFDEQVCMPINGKVQCIDRCISHIVACLNAGGVETTASCCGHGKQPGNIMLFDGRVIKIYQDMDSYLKEPKKEE